MDIDAFKWAFFDLTDLPQNYFEARIIAHREENVTLGLPQPVRVLRGFQLS